MNSLPSEVNRRLDGLLAGPAFKLEPRHHRAELLTLLQAELSYAADCNDDLRRYFEAWPIDYRMATRIADLPYLPVGVFKATPPLALVGSDKITRTLASSATSGLTPRRVVLDAETSKRMTKGLMTIIRDFIGPMRRPYLVIDTPESLATTAELGARAAAIQPLIRRPAIKSPCAAVWPDTRTRTAAGLLSASSATALRMTSPHLVLIA